MKSFDIAFVILFSSYYIQAIFSGSIPARSKEVGNYCPDGYFGPLCSDNCHCKYGKACDSINGSCEDGCAGHYKPPVCTTCSDGYFDYNCEGRCHCFEGNSGCDAQTGKCQSGKCSAGYDGENCQILTGYPSIESYISEEVVNVDQLFVVTCTVTGSPKPKVTLTSSSLETVDDGSTIDDGSTQSLTVEFLAGSVKGIYEINCEADNKHGKVAQTFNVAVVDPPQLVEPPEVSDVGATSLTLSWRTWQFGKDNGGFVDDTPEYQAVYRLVGDETWMDNGNPWQTSTTTRITNLIVDSNYEFAIRCKRNGNKGEGPVGPVVQSVTECTSPNEKGVPQGFSFKMISSSVAHLTWQPPNHEDLGCTLTGYTLRKLDIGLWDTSSVPTEIVQLDGARLDYYFKNLKPQIDYELFLSADTKFGKGIGHAILTIDPSDIGSVENKTVKAAPTEAFLLSFFFLFLLL